MAGVPLRVVLHARDPFPRRSFGRGVAFLTGFRFVTVFLTGFNPYQARPALLTGVSFLTGLFPQEKLEAWLGYHFVTGFTHAILFLDDASDEESPGIAKAVAATHGAEASPSRILSFALQTLTF